MKKLLIIMALLPVFSFGQTRVTTGSGDFLNPLIWNPMGIPTNGDSLIINHALTLTTDVYYNTGQIKINPSGSLVEDATDRNVWIDGGSLVNYGNYSSHLLYVSNGGYITNEGTLSSIDSMLVDAMFINAGIASINDFWVAGFGTTNNSGELYNTDSLLVQGTFINSGIAGVYDFAVDQLAYVENTSLMYITNNMHNQGNIYNTWIIEVGYDFSNCNTQSLVASLQNDGFFCIAHDFLNCDPDSIVGSGDYYVGNFSTNLGIFDGTHTFHTPTGSLTLNTGTIGSGVTVTAGTCGAGVVENEEDALHVYPNPTSGVLSIDAENVDYRIVDNTGHVVQAGIVMNGQLDLTFLANGIYHLMVGDHTPLKVVKR